ncbi:MAG: metal-dependent transcriptional regulator [Ferruginibacter sp.]
MKFSISEENYIKGIYHLQQHNEIVNTNLLAAELNSKAASVTDMLKKLNEKKIVQYQPYRGFKLNEKGSRIALGIVRRHRLWEYFLSEKLEMEWDKVHAIAEELEHVSSDELIGRLDNYLGNPKFDPHGDPIPDSKGNLPLMNKVRLSDAPLKKTATVCSVSDQTTAMLEMLKHYKIGINTKLKVIRQFDFDGSVEIKTGQNNTCTISKEVAKNIFVHYE